jgi:hypothetical protein
VIVEDLYMFRPPLLRGLIVQGMAILLLAGVSVGGFWQMTQAQVGPTFIFYLLLVLVGLSLAAVLVYCAYALYRADYSLERESVHLKWGLRIEDIPMASIEWVRTEADLDFSPPLPWLRWPGAVVGTRRLPDGNRLEYFAASTRHLVFIATKNQVFAISPDDPKRFLGLLGELMEMGSLTQPLARSVYPTLLVWRVWSDRMARYLILGGLALSLVLLVLVSFLIPSTPTISLRVDPTGAPLERIPSVQLMLLPVLNTSFFLGDFLLGLFFYRKYENQLIAYLLWGSSIFTGLLFLGALLFIMRTG